MSPTERNMMNEPVQTLRRASWSVQQDRGAVLHAAIHWVANAIESAAAGDPRMLAAIVNNERRSREQQGEHLQTVPTGTDESVEKVEAPDIQAAHRALAEHYEGHPHTQGREFAERLNVINRVARALRYQHRER